MSQATFEYRAFNRAGVESKGVASAATRNDAYRQLVAQGLTPVVLRPARVLASRTKRFKTRDLAHFTYQFSVLMQARIPLSDGLHSIAQQERPGPLKDMIVDLARRIESGENVATAMDHYKDSLGDVYVETVRAAEKSGNLTVVLEHLSEMIERTQETTRQVRAALMYPVCVSIVLTLATTFLIGFVVPRFAGIFSKRGATLPTFTRGLLDVGLSLQHFWWAYLGAVIIAVVCGRGAWRHPEGKMRVDAVLHRIPYLSRILKGLGISRFCRVFGLSLSSGLGLIDALTMAGRASGRPLLMQDAERMATQVRQGGRLTDAFAQCAYMTTFARRMLAAGEQSAEIPRMCTVVSKHYDRETTDLTKNMSTFIEPILIVFIASIVLLVALAIFLPMWDMVKIVG